MFIVFLGITSRISGGKKGHSFCDSKRCDSFCHPLNTLVEQSRKAAENPHS